MIFGNKNHAETYGFLDEKIRTCIEYMRTQDLASMELGIHEIDGKDIYVNLCEYVTWPVEERVWESHRKYLDIHYTVTGAERMDFAFLDKMEDAPYDEENDVIIMEGKAAGSLILNEGDFLVCYPQDVHRAAVKVDEPKPIRKAIFKVRL